MDGAASRSAIGTRPPTPPDAFRAWLVLVAQSFQRHWRVRQMGWVSLAILGLVVFFVALFTERGGWNLQERRVRRGAKIGNYLQESQRLGLTGRYEVLKEDERANDTYATYAVPNPLNPTADSLHTLILSAPQAVVTSKQFLWNWGFMKYTRWIVHLVFVGFVLPLFTLSYASGAFGTDRETRSLVWLMTRPIPRSGIYLAKFVGTLPWCLAFGMGGFVAICTAGGPYGREALRLYWPATLMATLAFASLFHLVGAIFRRPVVVGLVYVFFYETVVAALPGSLKLLSLSFYARSIMYNEAVRAEYPADMLPAMGEAVSDATAWAVLAAAAVGINALGMWLFARSDYRDDV